VPIIAGILAFVAGAYWLFSRNPQALVRFLDTPNIANAQNLSRVSYWLSAIQAYSEYDLAHSLFGNLGFFRHFYGNSAESDWLMLLLDTGLFGFLLYVLPFLYLVYLGARYRRRELAYLMLLLITISLYTHTATPTGNVVYWLWIMQTYRQLKLLQLRADPALARGRPVLQRISYLTDACHEIT
jgi:hypothetical protein